MRIDSYSIDLFLAQYCWDLEGLAEDAGIPLPELEAAMAGQDVPPRTVGLIARALDCSPREIAAVEVRK